MVQNKKIECHHCERHIGNKHKNLNDQSTVVVPVHKSTVTKTATYPKKIYPMRASESTEVVVIMKVQLICFGCNRHTTAEINITNEYSL